MKATAAALAICLLAALLEGAFSGASPEAYLARLAMPPFSPPLWAWYLIGAAYYVTCFVVLLRVIRHGKRGTRRGVALALVVALMVMNAVWNWVFFGMQDPLVSALVLVPYSVLAIALLVTLAGVDRAAALTLVPYVVYLAYADYWGFGVWRLNS
jgi:tryptophan-rich sensory protein